MLNCFASSHVLTTVSRQCLKSRIFFTMSQSRLVSTKSEISWLVSCLYTSVLANVSVSEKNVLTPSLTRCPSYHPTNDD